MARDVSGHQPCSYVDPARDVHLQQERRPVRFHRPPRAEGEGRGLGARDCRRVGERGSAARDGREAPEGRSLGAHVLQLVSPAPPEAPHRRWADRLRRRGEPLSVVGSVGGPRAPARGTCGQGVRPVVQAARTPARSRALSGSRCDRGPRADPAVPDVARRARAGAEQHPRHVPPHDRRGEGRDRHRDAVLHAAAVVPSTPGRGACARRRHHDPRPEAHRRAGCGPDQSSVPPAPPGERDHVLALSAHESRQGDDRRPAGGRPRVAEFRFPVSRGERGDRRRLLRLAARAGSPGADRPVALGIRSVRSEEGAAAVGRLVPLPVHRAFRDVLIHLEPWNQLPTITTILASIVEFGFWGLLSMGSDIEGGC